MRPRPRVRLGAFLAAGLAVAVVLAFAVAPRASRQPDGLARVARDEGLGSSPDGHALDDTPTAGYAVKGVHDDHLSTGLAGTIGVTVTFALAGGLFAIVRRHHRSPGVDPGRRDARDPSPNRVGG